MRACLAGDAGVENGSLTQLAPGAPSPGRADLADHGRRQEAIHLPLSDERPMVSHEPRCRGPECGEPSAC